MWTQEGGQDEKVEAQALLEKETMDVIALSLLQA